MLDILIIALVLWTAGEAGLALAIHRFRADFPWLLIPADAAPAIADDLARRYMATSFDARYGWLRRGPTTFSDETGRGVARYTINERHCRATPGFEDRTPSIAVYGDSYAFCRLVNDDETWPWYLSRLLDRHVTNRGVGNHGLDQALMRLEDDIAGLPEDTVVMAVVPETIARVRSLWKHYFEYGNVLAFKPRYVLEDGTLRHEPNPVQCLDDLLAVSAAPADIQRRDPFYAEKFSKDVLTFPFALSMLRHGGRVPAMLWHLAAGRITGNRDAAKRRAFGLVLKENGRWTRRLYGTPSAAQLLAALVRRFEAVCAEHGKRAVLVVIPQPNDMPAPHDSLYRAFFRDMATPNLTVFDATETIVRAGETAYVEGPLGPHLSPEGNAALARDLAALLAAMGTADVAAADNTARNRKREA